MSEPRPESGRPQQDVTPGSTAALERLARDILPALVARLSSSRLGELEVGSAGWHVRLRRGPLGASAAPGQEGSSARARPHDDPETAGAARSPAVGYFSPGRGVAVGRIVRGGDTLGYVDVLGVRQDVVAPVDGVLMRLLAEPGQAVEYGQVLAHVEAGTSLDDLPGDALPTSGPGGTAGPGASGTAASGGGATLTASVGDGA